MPRRYSWSVLLSVILDTAGKYLPVRAGYAPADYESDLYRRGVFSIKHLQRLPVSVPVSSSHITSQQIRPRRAWVLKAHVAYRTESVSRRAYCSATPAAFWAQRSLTCGALEARVTQPTPQANDSMRSRFEVRRGFRAAATPPAPTKGCWH